MDFVTLIISYLVRLTALPLVFSQPDTNRRPSDKECARLPFRHRRTWVDVLLIFGIFLIAALVLFIVFSIGPLPNGSLLGPIPG